ncbi:MAG: hypothetical protein KatS3mg029_0597 [Saprospiraceae bacterium]|nr:MAG: hypothetical protein KatS3mg029_0597 [Saprospiraceae bacterium]
MNRSLLILTCCFCMASPLWGQNSQYLAYIEKYKDIAIREMKRTGIPASIKLAQALLESNAGQSELARRANNHFGLKCHNDWTGKKYYKKDDDYDEFGNHIESCFRKYKSAEDSYIAHSEFLRDERKANRYGFLFRLPSDDYKSWARGLKRAGYATAANYDQKLIQLIELYQLHRFDKADLDEFLEDVKPDEAIAGLDVRMINDIRTVIAHNGITPQKIALAANISYKRLAKYNDLLPPQDQPLPEDYRVFLQPKRCNYRGRQKWHYVAEGQTLFEISQLYGVRLSRLYSRNRIPEGMEVQKGERIKLSGWRVPESKRPRLRNEHHPTSTVPVLTPPEDFLDEISPPVTTTPEPPSSAQPSNPPANPPVVTNPPSTQPPSGVAPVYHTVARGDTLYGIARRYGVTIEDIQRLNNLSGTIIHAGQKLRVR